MELLQQEESQFRYKLMNVFFQYLKNAFQLIFIGYEGLKLLNTDTTCTLSESTYIGTLYHGGLVLLVFNIVAAIYILYQKHFVRIEYFITYGLNMLWYITMIVFSVLQLLKGQCEITHMAVKYFIFSSTILQLDVLFVMLLRNEVSNRQVNICSNTAMVMLILTTPISDSCAVNILSVEIMLISANTIGIKQSQIALVFFTILNIAMGFFQKLKEQLSNAFKFVCVLVICFIILNYLLIVYYVQSGDILLNGSCISIDYITRTYCYVAPINMLGMFPILASFKFASDEQNTEPEVQGFQQSKMVLTPAYTPYKIIVNNNSQLNDEQFFMRKDILN